MTLVPELAESEDERIRKELKEAFEAYDIESTWNGIPIRSIFAWLEKQKELFESGRGLYYYDGEKTTYCGYPATEENPYDFAISQQEKKKEPHYTKRNALFDKCVENCDPKVMKRVSDEIDEMLEKEQKPVDKQDYSGLNDLEKVIHRGFLAAGVENVPVGIIKETAQECLTNIKPAWSEGDTVMCNAALALLRSHPNLMASNGINKSSIIRWLQSFRPQRQGFIDDICSKARISIPYLDGNQWCILKGDNIQSGVVGFGDTKEDALANFIKDVPIQQKWGKEDERIRKAILRFLNPDKGGTKYSSNAQLVEWSAWLKSLRPSWKPSEEQMEAL